MTSKVCGKSEAERGREGEREREESRGCARDCRRETSKWFTTRRREGREEEKKGKVTQKLRGDKRASEGGWVRGREMGRKERGGDPAEKPGPEIFHLTQNLVRMIQQWTETCFSKEQRCKFTVECLAQRVLYI